uniref:Uncharacterized protein n=1 Tax=Meloidogyne enterolobii TaxID=390850 RepID=A0A6V7XAB8_MELEN|nr:unnamed protein product [Meloidogyne enterolobii]
MSFLIYSLPEIVSPFVLTLVRQIVTNNKLKLLKIITKNDCVPKHAILIVKEIVLKNNNKNKLEEDWEERKYFHLEQVLHLQH